MASQVNAAEMADVSDQKDALVLLRMLEWAERELAGLDCPRSEAHLRMCVEALSEETGAKL